MIKDFVSLFFPRVCLTCGGSLHKGSEELCLNCLKLLPKTENHILAIPEFEERFFGLIEFDKVLVYLFFQKKGVVQRLLHELKYNDKPEIGEMLGRWYGHELSLQNYGDQFDIIIPIPLHHKKFKVRGYNQSEHFAEGMSKALNMAHLPKHLIKATSSESQTNKSRIERRKNVEGVFKVENEADIGGKRILLVDDVLTTGATLMAAADALLNANVKSVSFAVIAAAK